MNREEIKRILDEKHKERYGVAMSENYKELLAMVVETALELGGSGDKLPKRIRSGKKGNQASEGKA